MERKRKTIATKSHFEKILPTTSRGGVGTTSTTTSTSVRQSHSSPSCAGSFIASPTSLATIQEDKTTRNKTKLQVTQNNDNDHSGTSGGHRCRQPIVVTQNVSLRVGRQEARGEKDGGLGSTTGYGNANIFRCQCATCVSKQNLQWYVRARNLKLGQFLH
jgi:hypothetical protein